MRKFLLSVQAASVKSSLIPLTLVEFSAAANPCKSFPLITPPQF